jgi:hypothetical protein
MFDIPTWQTFVFGACGAIVYALGDYLRRRWRRSRVEDEALDDLFRQYIEEHGE